MNIASVAFPTVAEVVVPDVSLEYIMMPQQDYLFFVKTVEPML